MIEQDKKILFMYEALEEKEARFKKTKEEDGKTDWELLGEINDLKDNIEKMQTCDTDGSVIPPKGIDEFV